MTDVLDVRVSRFVGGRNWQRPDAQVCVGDDDDGAGLEIIGDRVEVAQQQGRHLAGVRCYAG
jgi:hypothetical protein